MTDIFDENGNAKETSVVTVYGVAPDTCEFNGEYEVRILAGTGIPAFTSILPPPESGPGKGIVLVGNDWEAVTDNRHKTAWSCESGTPTVIGYLGDLRDGFTLDAPSTPWDVWDGKKWVKDEAARLVAEIAAAVSEKSRLYAIASEKIAPLNDALDGGYIDENDKPLLIAWQKYRYDLTKVDTSSLPVVFPSTPV